MLEAMVIVLTESDVEERNFLAKQPINDIIKAHHQPIMVNRILYE